jgi:hypothetical protein
MKRILSRPLRPIIVLNCLLLLMGRIWLKLNSGYLLETEKTRNRKFGVYEHIKENFDKYVLSMDKLDFY